jgi:hypothetical protein
MMAEKKRQSLGRGLSSLLGEEAKGNAKSPWKTLSQVVISRATSWMR